MPNSVQYSETAVDNALNIGNLYVGAPASGPTSVSGFYAGITPPSGGYTVYLNKASGGPSIICPANDAALIAFTEELTGETMINVNACFAYFASGVDKMVMHNPITEMHLADLKLFLNAGSIPSYPRSGTTVYDLSDNDSNGGLVNGATFNSNGYLVFDGVDDYMIAYDVGISDYSQAFSMSILFRIDSGATWDNGFKSNIFGVNGGYSGMYGIYKDDDDEFGVQLRDADSTITTTCSGNVVNKWYNLTATWDGSTTLKLYRNGELVSTNNTGGITGSPDNDNFRIAGSRGYGGSAGNVFEGDIANCAYYTGLLSLSEIETNYYQGSIVTNGLGGAFDAGNLVSYENGSSTAINLKNISETGDLDNGVAFSSENGGTWVFDGVDDQIDFGNPSSFAKAQVTVTFWYNPTTIQNSAHNGIINGVMAGGSFCLFWIGTDDVSVQYKDDSGLSRAAGGVWTRSLAPTSISTTNQWYFIQITGNETTDEWRVGVNLDVSTSDFGSQYVSPDANQWLLGRRNSTSYDHGKIANLQIYDRILSQGEIEQNYNANVNKFN